MANTMRWRYGETNPIMIPVLVGYVIEIGDLVYLDTGTAKFNAVAKPLDHRLSGGVLRQ